jgi:hypothetical protein
MTAGLLAICENFSTQYNVTFNADKTKCVVFSPANRKLTTAKFSLAGKIIENVDQWHHAWTSDF